MNRRRQIRFTPEEQAAFLRAHRKAALTTMDKDGFPHIVAMNFFVKDGAFYMTSYGKAQKLLKIRRNPKVALMVEVGDKYSELRGSWCAAAARSSKGRTPCARRSRTWRGLAAPHTSGRAVPATARQNASC